MTIVLNFSIADKKRIKELLSGFEGLKVTAPFEEARAKIDNCIVTLYSSGKVVIQGMGDGGVRNLLLGRLGLAEEVIVGIDEVGRGEATGPFVVSAVLGDTNQLRELRDSKKIKNAEEKYNIATRNSLAKVSFEFSARYVDALRKRGLTMNSIEAKCIDAVVDFFKALDEKACIKVDGNKLDVKSRGVEFLPKGDDREPVIGAASIVATFLRKKSGDKANRETWKTK